MTSALTENFSKCYQYNKVYRHKVPKSTSTTKNPAPQKVVLKVRTLWRSLHDIGPGFILVATAVCSRSLNNFPATTALHLNLMKSYCINRMCCLLILLLTLLLSRNWLRQQSFQRWRCFRCPSPPSSPHWLHQAYQWSAHHSSFIWIKTGTLRSLIQCNFELKISTISQYIITFSYYFYKMSRFIYMFSVHRAESNDIINHSFRRSAQK